MTWLFITHLPVSQFYRVSFDYRHPYWVYGGLQDNGSWAGPNATYRNGGNPEPRLDQMGRRRRLSEPVWTPPTTRSSTSSPSTSGWTGWILSRGQRQSIRPGEPDRMPSEAGRTGPPGRIWRPRNNVWATPWPRPTGTVRFSSPPMTPTRSTRNRQTLEEPRQGGLGRSGRPHHRRRPANPADHGRASDSGNPLTGRRDSLLPDSHRHRGITRWKRASST